MKMQNEHVLLYKVQYATIADAIRMIKMAGKAKGVFLAKQTQKIHFVLYLSALMTTISWALNGKVSIIVLAGCLWAVPALVRHLKHLAQLLSGLFV